ncbi:MAG: DUF368 domain-containing protein [Eubacteriales bacterium]|nr:DUF368 domain-containing protein [Eubacteriales bacterium]
MLREGINGFCMALADSVPGVSGGTVAFIMGFYDRFIGSIHDLAFGRRTERRAALSYLEKLGIGWVIGMAAAATVLSALFESHIYVVSSLFLGFVAGSLPLVVREEKDTLRSDPKAFVFCLAGAALVAGITWANSAVGGAAMDLAHFSPVTAAKLFVIGMIAISAMFLPGISGSTLLLIFGAYMPVIHAVKEIFSFHFSYLPCMAFFVCGIVAGAATVVKAIRLSLERFRPQTVQLILGMMIGSFYAIVMGPTTLETPAAALSFSSLHLPAAALGVLLVLGMQMIKER